ncbi:MAG: ATP-binding protein [Lentisphaerales bacterium]|nr:ATP-binding protein [Lentisphaerales bacterium]
MNPYTFLPLAAFVVCGFLLAFVWGRGLKTELQKALVKLLICVTLWTFLDFVIWNMKGYPEWFVMQLYHLQMPSYFFIGPCLLIFVYKMLDRPEDSYYKSVFIWPILATLLGWFTPWVTQGYREAFWGLTHEPGPLFIWLTLAVSALPAEVAIVLTFKSLKNIDNKAEYTQRLLLAVGSGVALHVGIATNMDLSHWLGMQEVVQLGSCTVTIFAVFLYKSVADYDLIPISVETVMNELFEDSKQGLLMVDEHGQVVQYNHASNELLGEEYLNVGIQITELFPAFITDEGKKTEFTMNRTRQAGYPRHLRIQCERPYSKGRDNGWFYTVQDITKEKLADMEIRELNLTLERRVKERMVELASSNETLKIQAQELEELGRYKTEFMANLSHEIRTPMNAVMGFTDILLLDNELSFEAKKYLKNIKTSSSVLLDLLNDLLDFSKIENGNVSYEEVPINLESLIFEACDVTRARLESSITAVDLLVDMPVMTHKVKSDPIRLKQVLINLLSNAVKFTSFGEVCMKLGLLGDSNDSIKLRFSVIDTGIGIHPDEQERIFKAFIQADGTTTRKYGGTGLGLSISSQIIEGLGSQVKLKSQVGKGSDFSFDLVLKKGHKIDEAPLPRRMKALSLLKAGSINNIISDMLRSLNCEVTVGVNEKEVEKFFEQYEWFICSGFYFKKKYPKWEAILLASKVKVVVIDANLQQKYRTLLPESRFYRMSPPISRTALKNLFEFADSSQSSANEIQHLKILMAEDNMYNQAFQRTLLEKLGHTVIMADNGFEALENFRQEKFDLIFLDMHMPVIDGAEAAKLIRKENATIPIIGITANVTDTSRQSCFDSGMNWFLEKPLIMKVVEGVLLKVNTFERTGSFELEV